MSEEQISGPPDLRNRKNWYQAQSVFRKLVEQFHASGLLSAEDLAGPAQLWAKLDELRESGEIASVTAVIDHREDLLAHAERFSREREYALAVLFYALFFEHTLNGIISRWFERQGKPWRTAADAIRGVNFEGKSTWFLDVLDLPALNDRHRKVMSQVAQERNGFVHYKWSPMAETRAEHDRARVRLEALVGEAKKAATYLKRYEARLWHEGKKGRIATAARLERPSEWK